MGMRLTKAVTVVIDGEKFPLSDLMDQAESSLRVETGERVMARLSSVHQSMDQRDSTTATIELSVERAEHRGTGSSVLGVGMDLSEGGTR